MQVLAGNPMRPPAPVQLEDEVVLRSIVRMNEHSFGNSYSVYSVIPMLEQE